MGTRQQGECITDGSQQITGNHTVGGNLAVTGTTTLTGALDAVGGVTDSTNGTVKVKKITPATVPDGTEEDSGWDIPADAIVLDVFLKITTAEATGTTKLLDVGLKSGESGGDANGFLAAVDCSATGLVKGTLLNTGQTLGALLCVDEDGSGTLVPEPHICNGTAVSVTYTASANDWADFVGSIYIVYVDPA